MGPGDPSWTSALVALVLSWPFDAGIPPGKSVGPFDGTVTAGRPGDRSSSRVGVCRLRRWRCVLQPTPASPCADFSVGFSPSSVSVLQGATSPAINITVNGLNGFTGTVQITLSAFPAGVTSNPASPFAVAAGATVPILIGAAANAATGISRFPRRGPVEDCRMARIWLSRSKALRVLHSRARPMPGRIRLQRPMIPSASRITGIWPTMR